MRKTNENSSRRVRPFCLWGAAGLIFANLAFSILPCPAQQAKDGRIDSKRPAFDLTYLSPDAPGVLAVRPAAFFRRPAAKPLAAFLMKQMEPFLAANKIENGGIPSIDGIEQMILGMQFSHNPKKTKGERNTMMLSLVTIRTVKDFDWKKTMRSIMANAERLHYKDAIYYKGKIKIFPLPSLDLCYHIPDGRTIVFQPSEKHMHSVLDKRSDAREPFAWAEDWRRVEHGVLAAALDMRRMMKIVDAVPDPELAPLFKRATAFVLGIDLNQTLRVSGWAVSPDEKAAKRLAKWARQQLAEESEESEQVMEDLRKQAKLLRHGARISLHTHAKYSIADLAKTVMSAKPAK